MYQLCVSNVLRLPCAGILDIMWELLLKLPTDEKLVVARFSCAHDLADMLLLTKQVGTDETLWTCTWEPLGSNLDHVAYQLS